MDKKKKIVLVAVAIGCLLVGLTAGFIAGKNSSKVIIESEPYHMEDADYSVGVSEEPNGGPDEELENPLANHALLPTQPTPTANTTNSGNTSGNNGGNTSSSGGQGSGIGVDVEEDDGGGGGNVPGSGDNKEEGGNTEGGNTQPEQPDPKNVSYYDYMNMSSDEKNNFAGQFSSGKDFIEWKNAASEDYAKQEAESTYSGSVNIDETFGND